MMPLTSACESRSSTVPLRHASSSFAVAAPCALDRLGEREQPLGGVGAAVEQHVLDELEQVASGSPRRSRAGRR